MAVIKRYSSAKKSVKSILDYVMDKDKTQDGKLISSMNCSPKTVLEEMAATKELYNKTDGVKYHHIIQSFSPGEITPEKAHELGKELAEKKFKDFECIITTHVDKDHIHNHIVYNSVNQETGRKYNASNKSLWDLKRESNLICEREGLKQIDLENRARENITSAELRIFLRGEKSWKEELRDCINTAKEKSSSLEEMQKYLKEKYNVDMKVQNKNLSFLHPEKEKYIRGSKLGENYTKGEIENELTRRKTREEGEHSRGIEGNQGDVIWSKQQYGSIEGSPNQDRGLSQGAWNIQQGQARADERVSPSDQPSLQNNERAITEGREFINGIYEEERRGVYQSSAGNEELENGNGKQYVAAAQREQSDLERGFISNSNSSWGELGGRADIVLDIETNNQVKVNDLKELTEQMKAERIKEQQERELREKERLLQKQKEKEQAREESRGRVLSKGNGQGLEQ